MPGPRRITPRSPPPVINVNANKRDGNGVNGCYPRHVCVPEIPIDNTTQFEGMIFMFSIASLGLQLINLYKTMWWLPHSRSQYALNFYLIDPHLVTFVTIIMMRRLLWALFQSCSSPSRSAITYWVGLLLLGSTSFCLCSLLLFSLFKLFTSYSPHYSLFLIYPFVVYMFWFKLDIRPFFTRNFVCPRSVKDEKRQIDINPLTSQIHSCSQSPEDVREEVENFKSDFNNRVKQVLFNSMAYAYYMTFVPLCFAQSLQYSCDECWNSLYYDAWWVGQHVALTWMSGLVLFTTFYLPANYTDMLHRASLHLGNWTEVDYHGRNQPGPHHSWSELQLWGQGCLVKHVRGLFRAEGPVNAAEPGNGTHKRFYFLFHDPLRVTTWLLYVLGLIIAYQFVFLTQALEWSHILSLAFQLFCNYYALFKLMRDRIVLSRAYKNH